MYRQLLGFLQPISFWAVILTIIDLGIITWSIYRLMLLLQGTRAVQLLRGILVLLVIAFLGKRMNLITVNWVLSQLGLMIVVALPVVFQPELRRALAQLGRGKLFARSLIFLGEEDMSRLVDELVRSVQILAKGRIGALMVIERETGLRDYAEAGVKVDGIVSAELLLNIFNPRTPLHDGAVVIRGDRVLAAGCFLPLTESPYLSKQLGSRHRAALGITEVSDCIAVVVSEETGTISVAEEGRLTRYLDEKNLTALLQEMLLGTNREVRGGNRFWPWKF